jgi:hypothetical protein
LYPLDYKIQHRALATDQAALTFPSLPVNRSPFETRSLDATPPRGQPREVDGLRRF